MLPRDDDLPADVRVGLASCQDAASPDALPIPGPRCHSSPFTEDRSQRNERQPFDPIDRQDLRRAVGPGSAEFDRHVPNCNYFIATDEDGLRIQHAPAF